jgi:hypothetical protein
MAIQNLVNLDALLPREDLAAPANGDGNIRGIKISELEPGPTYSLLRKPDFQRETANWSPDQVADLISTAVRGDIIPAIILWDSGRYTYVIDGAHRLSALIAWVRDDYGAGPVSMDVYKGVIPDHQRLMHERTRTLVNDAVGSYHDLKAAGANPEGAAIELVHRASRLSFREIDAQWIRNATVVQARDAFFRINQGGSKIEDTELKILRAGSSPLAIASRAIARGGSGHAYWSQLEDEDARAEVPKLGKEINRLLFTPEIARNARTLDVPMAGLGYGANVLPFVFDVVSTANRLSDRKGTSDSLAIEDKRGDQTVQILRRTLKCIELLCSNKAWSLGLHPALYFYTSGGGFHPTALTNTMEWFMDLEDSNRIRDFVRVRGSFEKLLIAHPVIAKPAANRLGAGRRSRPRSKELFTRILRLLLDGKSIVDVWQEVSTEERFAYLATADLEDRQGTLAGIPGGKFSGVAKSAAFLAQALPHAQKCELCEGLMHMNGMANDHIIPRSEGGTSASANGRWVHPRCNSERDKNDREAGRVIA